MRLNLVVYDQAGDIVRWRTPGMVVSDLQFSSSLPGGFGQCSFAVRQGRTRGLALAAGQALAVRRGLKTVWWGWIEDVRTNQAGSTEQSVVLALGPWQQLQQRLVDADIDDVISTHIVRDLLAAYAPDVSQDYSQLENSGVSLTKEWTKASLASVVEEVCATGDSSNRPLLFAIWEPPGSRLQVGTAGNLLPDPEMEFNEVYWTPGDPRITWVTSPYNSAAHSWKFPEGMSNGVFINDRITVAANTNYVTDHYVYWTAYSGMTSRFRVDWYDIANTIISSTYTTGISSDGVTTGWQRCIETITSPAGAVEAVVHCQGIVGSGGGAARYLCIDDVNFYLETANLSPDTKGRAHLWPRDLTDYDYLLRTADLEKGVEATTTTRDLANAVIASYGSSSYTDWAEDAASQALYRRRDALISASVALANAEAQRDVHLAVHAAPGVEMAAFTVARPGAVRTPQGQAVDPADLRAGDRLRIVDGGLAGSVIMLSEVRWKDGAATCRPENYEDITRTLARVEV